MVGLLPQTMPGMGTLLHSESSYHLFTGKQSNTAAVTTLRVVAPPLWAACRTNKLLSDHLPPKVRAGGCAVCGCKPAGILA